MPWRCGWKSKLARACIPPLMKTLTVSISPLTLSTVPTLGVLACKIQIPKFGGKKGHPHDVADTFRQWACCITYYHDYYEDSYLIPLVVSSLTGDASDVFDWILSLNPGNTQDLTTVLQML